MPQYTVVGRTRASAVFYPGTGLKVQAAICGGPSVTVKMWTDFQEGFSVPLPTNLCFEAIGSAADIDTAARDFHTVALRIATVAAFATNAHLGHFEVELAFDSDEKSAQHEFLQSFVETPSITHVPGRPIDPNNVADLISKIDKHPEEQRLFRAISQYVEALRRWNSGHEIMCLAHLYMGVEALTKASLRMHLAKTAISQEQLLQEWNVELKKLDGEVRLRLIFQNDKACFRDAKEVSDAFEHGFAEYSELHKPARDTVAQVAKYLRTAIVDIAVGKDELANRLLTGPYADARGPVKLLKYVRGTMTGPASMLAMQGRQYPQFDWKTRLKTVEFDQNGRYSFMPEEAITAALGDGVSMAMRSIEIRDDDIVSVQPAPSTPTVS